MGWRTTQAGSAVDKKLGDFNLETMECLTLNPETGVYTSDQNKIRFFD